MTVNIDKQWFLDRMEDQGLNRSEVARLMGIHKSALSRALDGKRQIKAPEIVEIATILRVAPSEVFDHVKSIPKKANLRKKGRQGEGTEKDTAPSDGSGGASNEVGFETEAVDTAGERLVSPHTKKSVPESRPASSGATEGKRRPLHPGIGFMKGLIKIEPGFDVTGPFSDESWEDGYLGEDRLPEGYVKKAQK